MFIIPGLPGPFKNCNLFVFMKADQCQMNLFCLHIFSNNYTRTFFTSYLEIWKTPKATEKLHRNKNGFGYGTSVELCLLIKTQLLA